MTYAYRAGEPIVRDWGAAFPGGSVTAITGPSGIGKSTLLYVLGLMLKPQNGRVRLDGQLVSDLPDAQRSRLRAYEFGFVFQDAALDATRTVVDNVIETALYRRQPRREAVAEARVLLERFDVGVRASHRPGQISGGQAQRIALCRALLAEPKVVLADEPTGNLDRATADVVITALRERAEAGGCVVIATHDPSVVERCDQRFELGGAS